MNDNQEIRIIDMRKQVYQTYKSDLEDICFSIFICPSCNDKIIDKTLLPIIDKEFANVDDLLNTRKSILAQIFNAEFDFLHEKYNCKCEQNSIYELRKVIYCYNQNEIDYHNYINYPFETIITHTHNLINKIKKFLFFDTETTGLPKNWKASYKDTNNWPRLVQIAWIVSDDLGNIIGRQSFLIKPDNFIIPIEASNVHKITTEKAISEGVELKDVLKLFNNLISESNYLVAHNINFDINVMASEFFRLNIESEIFEKKQICTMAKTTNYCAIMGPYGLKWPTLLELHLKLFNSTFSDAHDALVDIDITFKCYNELIKKQIIKL